MNSRVKHWLIFIIFTAVIVACVVVTLLFGDVTLPNDMKIVYDKNFVLESYEVKENPNAPLNARVDVGETNMSEKQYLDALGIEASANTIKFNKQEDKCIVSSFGTTQSVAFSKKGANLTITTNGMPGVTAQTNKFKIFQNTLTNTYNAGKFIITQTYKVRDQDIILADKKFKFSSYEFKADSNAADKINSSVARATQAQMNANLQNSWLFFDKISQSKAVVKFVNSVEKKGIEWQYATTGVGAYLYPTLAEGEIASAEQRLVAEVSTDAVKGERVILRTATANSMEMITFERDNHSFVSQVPAGYVELRGHTVALKNVSVTPRAGYDITTLGNSINKFIEEGLYQGDINDTYEDKLFKFKTFAQSNNSSRGYIPPEFKFSTSMNSCSVTGENEIEGNSVLQDTTELMYSDGFAIDGSRRIYVYLPGLPTLSLLNGTVGNAYAYSLELIAAQSGQTNIDFNLKINSPFDDYFSVVAHYQWRA